MKYKKLGLFLSVCLVLCLVSAWVHAGGTYTHRERLESAPMSIDMMASGDTDWAIRVQDSSEVERFRIGDDGTPELRNSSGTKVWAVDANGIMESGTLHESVVLTGTTVGGYTITGPSQGSVFELGANVFTEGGANPGPATLTEGGVTVTLPTPTAATHGWEITLIYNWSSATSPMVPYAGGLPIGNTSSVSPYAFNSAIDMDAVGDTLTLISSYDSEVSYWVKSYAIQ